MAESGVRDVPAALLSHDDHRARGRANDRPGDGEVLLHWLLQESSRLLGETLEVLAAGGEELRARGPHPDRREDQGDRRREVLHHVEQMGLSARSQARELCANAQDLAGGVRAVDGSQDDEPRSTSLGSAHEGGFVQKAMPVDDGDGTPATSEASGRPSTGTTCA